MGAGVVGAGERVSPRWLDQVEELARTALPGPVFRYVAEGARDEVTLSEAVAAWTAVRFAPHVLRDVREIELRTRLLGTEFAAPLGIAPMTLQRAADPDGELAMARAAAAAGVPLVLSTNAGSTFADVGATGVTWWLQAYVTNDRAVSEPLLAAAVEAGASAVVVTADTPVLGTRYPGAGASVWDLAEDDWVGVNHPTTQTRPQDRDKALDLVPDDIGWLRRVTGVPVVVKGVLRGDDAARCAEAGAAAVWVSTHGGRQLDQALPTARAVAGVRAGVGDRAQVFVDGGVRSGLHAMAGLGLGADAVFVGRPLFHALAAGGEDGVRRALTELRDELEESMRLGGCRDASELGEIVLEGGIVPPTV